ncbi:MAG TPA: cyclodeaminase/cyclohydrolase family protein [Tepidisphaeraceae bacterium]|nr:cyclodeaminase/cyclohydrolase family protein [Tepidisphaeraceae bacterium]
MYDKDTSIGTFLDAAAAKQPAPGGGSATALVGALAAAMGEMTINYSVGKKGLEAHQDELQKALAELQRARKLMLSLMVEDQLAYEALTAARKLAEGSPQRDQEISVSLLACIRVPEAMAATAVAVLELCDRVVNEVNYYLLSDLAVCADLAMATVRCAIYNVRVNLPELQDAGARHEAEETIGKVLSHARMSVQRVGPRIWERHAAGK